MESSSQSITSKTEHVKSDIGNSLLAFSPGVEVLTGINQVKRRLIDFYCGKMCMVNEDKINSKTETFSFEAPRENTALWDWVEGTSWLYSFDNI